MDLYKVLSTEHEVTLGGRTFVMGKLTLKDQAEVDEYIDQRCCEEAKKTMKELGLTDAKSYLALKNDPDLRLRISAETKTSVYIIHKLINKKQSIDFNEFCELITMDELINMEQQAGLKGEENENEETAKKNENQEIP